MELLLEINTTSKVDTSPKKWLSVNNYNKILSMKDFNLSYYEIEDLFKKSISTSDDEEKWKKFLSSDYPFNEKLPANFEKLCEENDFHRLVLVKLIREEKLIFAIKTYIERNMGKKFIEPPPFSVSSAFDDSLTTTPLIFILSPGANPIGFLKRYAIEKGIHVNNISLGQGQGEKAKSYMREARDKGKWICLENCHLSINN